MVSIIFNSCRVCLSVKVVENEIWKSITEIDDNNLTISDKIELLSGISPNLSSGLALLICQPCVANLKIAYDFRIACRNSENIITNFLMQYKKHTSQENELANQFKIEINHSELNNKEILMHQQQLQQVEIDNNNSDVESNFETDTDEDCNHYYSIANENNSQYSDDNEVEPVDQQISSTKNKCRMKCKVAINKSGKICEAKHSKTSTEEKIFVCELCGNVYKKRALLTDHMRWHSGSKDFKCEICGKAFLLNTYLARHIRTHTGIRNYKCSFCSRTFYTNGLKRAHEKVHTGERCYKCELCSRTFSYSQSLQRHMLVHSGVKPHKCEDCGKEFRQESHLKQHMATNIHQTKQQHHQKTKPENISELDLKKEIFYDDNSQLLAS